MRSVLEASLSTSDMTEFQLPVNRFTNSLERAGSSSVRLAGIITGDGSFLRLRRLMQAAIILRTPRVRWKRAIEDQSE